MEAAPKPTTVAAKVNAVADTPAAAMAAAPQATTIGGEGETVGHGHSHGGQPCDGGHGHSHGHGHVRRHGADDDDDDDDFSSVEGNEEESDERDHFLDCVRALLDYRAFMVWQARTRQAHFDHLPLAHRERCPGGPSGMRSHTLRVLAAARTNARFLTYVATHNSYSHQSNHVGERTLDRVVDAACTSCDPQARDEALLGDSQGPQVFSTRSRMSKVCSSLRQLVRDWTAEGAEERRQCYDPVIAEMQKVLPITPDNKNTLMVFLPGSGLSRLMVELCAAGYKTVGNEFDYFMLLVSNFMLNVVTEAGCFEVYPWLDEKNNFLRRADQLRSFRVPDVPTVEILAKNPGHWMSMAQGEWMDIIQGAPQRWDGFVTCFVLDTAPNAISYIETIWHALVPGGVWVNHGPLLYHWSDGDGDARYAESVEFTMEELQHVIRSFGFEFVTECDRHECYYNRNRRSMHCTRYDTVLFSVRKPLTAGGAGAPTGGPSGSGGSGGASTSRSGDGSSGGGGGGSGAAVASAVAGE